MAYVSFIWHTIVTTFSVVKVVFMVVLGFALRRRDRNSNRRQQTHIDVRARNVIARIMRRFPDVDRARRVEQNASGQQSTDPAGRRSDMVDAR